MRCDARRRRRPCRGAAASASARPRQRRRDDARHQRVARARRCWRRCTGAAAARQRPLRRSTNTAPSRAQRHDDQSRTPRRSRSRGRGEHVAPAWAAAAHQLLELGAVRLDEVRQHGAARPRRQGRAAGVAGATDAPARAQPRRPARGVDAPASTPGGRLPASTNQSPGRPAQRRRAGRPRHCQAVGGQARPGRLMSVVSPRVGVDQLDVGAGRAGDAHAWRRAMPARGEAPRSAARCRRRASRWP